MQGDFQLHPFSFNSLPLVPSFDYHLSRRTKIDAELLLSSSSSSLDLSTDLMVSSFVWLFYVTRCLFEQHLPALDLWVQITLGTKMIDNVLL